MASAGVAAAMVALAGTWWLAGAAGAALLLASLATALAAAAWRRTGRLRAEHDALLGLVTDVAALASTSSGRRSPVSTVAATMQNDVSAATNDAAVRTELTYPPVEEDVPAEAEDVLMSGSMAQETGDRPVDDRELADAGVAAYSTDEQLGDGQAPSDHVDSSQQDEMVDEPFAQLDQVFGPELPRLAIAADENAEVQVEVPTNESRDRRFGYRNQSEAIGHEAESGISALTDSSMDSAHHGPEPERPRRQRRRATPDRSAQMPSWWRPAERVESELRSDISVDAVAAVEPDEPVGERVSGYVYSEDEAGDVKPLSDVQVLEPVMRHAASSASGGVPGIGDDAAHHAPLDPFGRPLNAVRREREIIVLGPRQDDADEIEQARLTERDVPTTDAIVATTADADAIVVEAGSNMNDAPVPKLRRRRSRGPARHTEPDAEVTVDALIPASGAGQTTSTGNAEPDDDEGLPAFALTALDGRIIRRADLAGRLTLLVFWRPACAHCAGLAPELQAWVAANPEDGPRLVVVAACQADGVRDAGFAGIVLLDPAFTIGRAVGISGTPAALLLGPNGRPFGQAAAGATAVIGLAHSASRAWSALNIGDDDALEEQEMRDLVDQEVTSPEYADERFSSVSATLRPAVLHRRTPLSQPLNELDDDGDDLPAWHIDHAARRTG